MIVFGEIGLVPSRLMFGIISWFPILSSNMQSQKERIEVLKTAQSKMNSIEVERKVSEALVKHFVCYGPML